MRAAGLYLLAILVLLAALTAIASHHRPRKERPTQQLAPKQRHHHHKNCKHKHRHRHKQSKLPRPWPRPKAEVETLPTATDHVATANNPKIPISRDIAVEGNMFFFAKYVQCPQHKELKCKDHFCANLTCEDAGIYKPYLCPRLPSKCTSLYCACANSQGYFKLSSERDICVKKDECGIKNFNWVSIDIIDGYAGEDGVKAGKDESGKDIYVMRAPTKDQSLYPGTYQMAGDGFVINYANVIEKVDKMEILEGDIKWEEYSSINIIPKEAIKAGISRSGVPQYIGRKKVANAQGEEYTVLGRVEFGQLLLIENDMLQKEQEFEILLHNPKKIKKVPNAKKKKTRTINQNNLFRTKIYS